MHVHVRGVDSFSVGKAYEVGRGMFDNFISLVFLTELITWEA